MAEGKKELSDDDKKLIREHVKLKQTFNELTKHQVSAGAGFTPQDVKNVVERMRRIEDILGADQVKMDELCKSLKSDT